MFLITGATGNIGRELVKILAGDGHPVRALTRSPDRVPDLPRGVQVCAGDLDHPASLKEALDGVRGVFVMPGYRDMPGLLRTIRDAGAERVVLLSGASAETGDTSNAVTAYMTASEKAVRESGLPATVLRPAGFMSNTLQWVPQLRAGDVVRAPFADVAIAMIDPYDIAAVAAAGLVDPGHAGRVYRLSGPEPLRPADRVRTLAELTGRPLRFDAQPDDEARVEMSAVMPAEYVDAFFDFYAAGSLDESPVLPTVEQVTGRPPRTFMQWAREHIGAFHRTGR